MSTATPSPERTSQETDAPNAVERALSVGTFRLFALVGILVLTGSYVWVLRDVTIVVGGSDVILPVVVLTLVVATGLARSIDGRTATVLTLALAVLGYGYYLLVVPDGLSLLFERANEIVADVVALLTGLSVLRIAKADVWALGFVPAPVFLSWYLAIRRRYLAGAAVGGLALLVLVLTGDAGIGTTLVGVLGGIAAVGFGELDRRGGTLLQADVLVVLVALITLVGLTPLVVPGAADPLDLGVYGGGGTGTVEGTFVGTPGQMEITGSINLSPTVRYTVEAEQERYWRTGVYDRFTGDGWRRTGRAQPYDEGLLDSPPGPRETLVQTYTAETQVKTMPAAGEPVEVVGEATRNAEVTAHDTLRPSKPFIEGDRYRIRSRVLNATPEQLRAAPTEYPQDVRQRYLELPATTSDRFREVTAQITVGTDNPYDAAKRIERYLQQEKEYSLTVEKPDGNVANAFLLEMDAGYCTYFATTMVAMLRSEGVPARVAVGYTSGQQIEDDQYLVRGLDSHVWVEAYFPEYGWVTFDPTPAGAREAAENERIREGREGNAEGPVDTDGSEDVPVTTTTTLSLPNGTTNGTIGGSPGTITIPGAGDDGTIPQPLNGTAGGEPAAESGGSGGLPPLPSGRDAAVGMVLLLGVAAGAHRVGVGERLYRAARLRWQGSLASPRADVERAYERLEMLLAREYRPRRPGETHREYLDSLAVRDLDERIRRVVEIHERARYAGEVDPETARQAVGLVDSMVRERTPVLGRLRRSKGRTK